MKSNTIKVAWACFLGAFIGSIVALRIGHNIWWNVTGLIVGAFIGYVSYSFKEIPAAAQKVWQAMPERKTLGVSIKGAISIFVLDAVVPVGAAVLMILMFCIMFMGLCNTCDILVGTKFIARLPDPYLFYIGGTVFIVLTATLFALCLRDEICPWKTITCISVFSPVCVPVTLVVIGIVILIFAGIVIYKLTPILAFAVCGFVWRTFKLIHSDMRLLCMTDAALGVLVGWTFDSIILGGIAGLILGVLNYELVSVRWLKLVPRIIGTR